MEHAKACRRVTFSEDTRHFIADPFRTDTPDFRRHLADGLPRFLLDRVSETRTEPNGTKQSQLVFLEPFFWFTYCADDAISNVFLTADIIDDPLFDGIVEKSVDREITPQDVRTRVCEDNADGRRPSM